MGTGDSNSRQEAVWTSAPAHNPRVLSLFEGKKGESK